jgi:hypothetical protein
MPASLCCILLFETIKAFKSETSVARDHRQEYYSTPVSYCSSSVECFTAACDWSRATCFQQRQSIAECPILDAAVLLSARAAQGNNSLLEYMAGGTARFCMWWICIRLWWIYKPCFLPTIPSR